MLYYYVVYIFWLHVLRCICWEVSYSMSVMYYHMFIFTLDYWPRYALLEARNVGHTQYGHTPMGIHQTLSQQVISLHYNLHYIRHRWKQAYWSTPLFWKHNLSIQFLDVHTGFYRVLTFVGSTSISLYVIREYETYSYTTDFIDVWYI